MNIVIEYLEVQREMSRYQNKKTRAHRYQQLQVRSSLLLNEIIAKNNRLEKKMGGKDERRS